jgi:cyclopropane fatty-acyl-phospholipid synthase-like methyltransferase
MYKILEVNGDSPNSILEKFLLTIDIAHGFFTESKVTQSVRYESPSKELLDIFSPRKISPGRMACTGFMNYFFKSQFGSMEEIKVLDFGCGDGTYRDIIQFLLPNCKVTYVGCDIYRNNHLRLESHEFIEFKDIKNLFKSMNDKSFYPDLIFSQSVFEHIKDDRGIFMALLNEFPKSSMLHVIPGGASGLQYVSHGYRRYTLKQLERKFTLSENFNMDIYPIGGPDCFSLFPDYEYQYREAKHRFESILHSMSNRRDWIERDASIIDSLMHYKGQQRPTFWAFFVNPSKGVEL